MTCSVSAGTRRRRRPSSFSTIRPSGATTPAAALVPPTSMPIVRRTASISRWAGGVWPGAGGRAVGPSGRAGPAGGQVPGAAPGPPVPRPPWGVLCGAWRRLYDRLEGGEGLLDHGGEGVTGPGQGRAYRPRGIAHPAGRAADRAPRHTGCFVMDRARRGGFPHVSALTGRLLAHRPAHLPGRVPGGAARTRTHQPSLEVTHRVSARRAWPEPPERPFGLDWPLRLDWPPARPVTGLGWP